MTASPVRFVLFWGCFFVWAVFFIFYLVHRAGEASVPIPSLLMGVAAAGAVLPYLALSLSANDLRLRAMIDGFLALLDRQPVVFLFLVAVGVITALLWTFFTGAELDYKAHYLVQWRAFLYGQNPWEASWEYQPLAIGPLHVVFAPLAALFSLLPKFLFLLSFFAAVILIGQKTLDQPADIQVPFLAFCILVVFSPYFWSLTAHLGFVDALIGFMCVLAFVLRVRGARGWAGVSLGAASLVHFYPLFALPFLSISREGFVLKPLIIGAAVAASGYAVGYALWGEYVLLAFGVDEPAKWLSIYRALEAHRDLGIDAGEITWTSWPLMIGAGVMVLLFCYLRQVPPALGAALGMLAALLLHRVGHIQFYGGYIMLLAYCLGQWTDKSVRGVVLVSLPYVMFLTWFMIWYDLTLRYGEMGNFTDELRGAMGLIAFPFGVVTLVFSCMLAGDRLRENIFSVRWALRTSARANEPADPFES